VATVSPNQSNIQQAVRSFLLAVLPATGSDGKPISVIAGQQNRSAEPAGSDFVVMTPVAFERLWTNVDASADVKVVGSIVGTTLSITEVISGAVTPGASLFGTGVAPGTTVVKALGGTAGTQFQVSPSQSAGPQTMSAGATSITQGTNVTVQLDFHGSNDTVAGDMAQTVSTLLRDPFGVTFFAGLDPPMNGVVPLHADDPRQVPFINAEQAYEWRWILEAHLQVNQNVQVPQQYADAATVEVEDVTALYPP
jgi:hypothetical protein